VNRDIRVLLASQPTRGLDVGSIEFVHRRIVEQRDQGVAVVIVSSELDEIYALADRIAVMYEGKITGFRPPTVSVGELGLLMAGSSDSEAAQAGQEQPEPADHPIGGVTGPPTAAPGGLPDPQAPGPPAPDPPEHPETAGPS
jgi:general nucleoside transport system ATP-binding protein